MVEKTLYVSPDVRVRVYNISRVVLTGSINNLGYSNEPLTEDVNGYDYD